METNELPYELNEICCLLGGVTISSRMLFTCLAISPNPGKITIAELAKWSGQSRNTVIRSIKELENLGLLEVIGKTHKRDYKIVWNTNYFHDAALLTCQSWKEAEDEKVNFEVTVTPEVYTIILYWNALNTFPKVSLAQNGPGVYTVNKTTAKTVDKLNKLLEGSLFNAYRDFRFYHDNPWTVEQVVRVIDHFHVSATDPAYYPQNKDTYKKKTLGDFLLNPFGSASFLSPFLTVVDGPKPTGVKFEKCVLPGLLFSIKTAWKNMMKIQDFTPLEEQRLINGVNMLAPRIESWKSKDLILPVGFTHNDWARVLTEFIWDNPWISEPLSALSHNWLWNKFTSYCVKKRILSDA